MTLTSTNAETGEFAEFYAANFQRIAGQLYAYLGDFAEAQDLTQEAFCRALDRWGKVVAFADPAAWVRRVAWNLATSRLRHLQVVTRHLSRQRVEHIDGPSPDRVALIRALASIPPNHRLAVVLHHLGHMSVAEIAEQEGAAEGTVRSWLSRGRSQLAEYFVEKQEPEWEAAATEAIRPAGVQAAVSVVRRRRATRRSMLAVLLVLAIAVPVAILVRARGGDPPIIGPTNPPASPSPSPAVTLATVAQPFTSCEGQRLELPRGARSSAVDGGDRSGRYLMGSVFLDTDRPEAPVLWDNGAAMLLPAPQRIVTGLAVNSRGIVAGSSAGGQDGPFTVWLYVDGRVDVIQQTDDAGQALRVKDINERGDILVDGLDWRPAPKRHPAVITGGLLSGFRELPLPLGVTSAYAKAIDDDGTVIGTASPPHSGGSVVALMWQPSKEPAWLSTPTDHLSSPQEFQDGWIIGTITQDPLRGIRFPVRWSRDTLEAVPIASTLDVTSSVTADGWVVGATVEEIAESSTRTSYRQRPAIDMGGKIMRLPPVPGIGTRDDPRVMYSSVDGRVIAGETKAAGTGSHTAVRWVCS